MISPWASAYIGIPFQIGGSTRESCDCWGLLAMVYRDVFGISLPSYAAHYDSTNRDVLAGVVEAHLPSSAWRPVAPDTKVPGDGLLFRIAGQPVHVGLFVGDGRFLHVLTAGTQSCIERLDAPRWARRLLGVYRYAAD